MQIFKKCMFSCRPTHRRKTFVGSNQPSLRENILKIK